MHIVYPNKEWRQKVRGGGAGGIQLPRRGKNWQFIGETRIFNDQKNVNSNFQVTFYIIF